MKFFLAVVLLAAQLCFPVRAQEAPQTAGEARVALYVDDDETVVWRPLAAASAAWGDTELRAHWSLDAVSSASIDVVTRASQAVRDERHELGCGLAQFGARSSQLAVNYTHAFERDYQTHGVSLLAGRDLDPARQWHGQVALSGDRSEVGAVNDRRFSRMAHGLFASASLARLVSSRGVLRASFEAGATWGYQASPYRTVRLGDWVGERYTGPDTDAGQWVFTEVTGVARESHPQIRRRVSFGVDGVRDLGASLAVKMSLGGYWDSWQVRALDGDVELRWEATEALYVRTAARLYVQSAAHFWQPRYVTDVPPRYISDDKELGALRSYGGMLAAAYTWRRVTLDLRAELTRYTYRAFTLLPRKRALATQLGLRWLL